MSKSVRDLLVELGYKPKDSGKYWRVKALFRGSKDYNIAVNKKTGGWVDFSHGRKGGIDDLVKITLGQNADVESYTYGVNLDFSEEITMPKTYDPECLERLLPNYSYWNERGVSDITLKELNNGVAHSGKMYRRSVFPIFNPDGKIYGFAGRAIADGERTKWKLIGGKSNWAYPYYFNKDAIHSAEEVIIVESIGDFLSLYENGVKNILIAFGVTIGRGLLNKLLKLNYNIVVAFNNDSGGNYAGNIAAIKNFVKLSELFDLDSLSVKLPPKKDFGDCSADDIERWKKSECDYSEILRFLEGSPRKTAAEKRLVEKLKWREEL